MKTAKLGAIFLVSVLALAGTGVAYACWYETLTINGTVNTGNLDAEWSVGVGYDTEPPEKDYSSISGVISPDGYTLTVTITNAYPCIDYYLPIDIHNTGTIPLHIWAFVYDPGTMPCGIVEIIPDPANPGLPIAICTQLHPDPDTPNTAYGLLHVHLCQAAAENAIYTFSYTVTVANWNCAD